MRTPSFSDQRITKRRYKIGVSAESFGFGPASKAAAVMRSLDDGGLAEGCVLADSVAYEYLSNEMSNATPPLYPTRPEDLPQIQQIVSELDAAIVALDPVWVSFLVPLIPVVFIDSLGFMWSAEHFDRNQSLLSVHYYAVQDIFDSVSRLQTFGIPNLVPVGALVDIRRAELEVEYTNIVHLGGLINIFSSSDGLEYADYVTTLLRGIISTESTAILTSKFARCSAKVFGGFRTMTVNHRTGIGYFSSARFIYTSPGLTTLLELAKLGTPVVPLPPQNFSQALIIKNLTRRYSGLPRIWHYLAEKYVVPEGIPEADGVRQVTSMNRNFRQESSFREEYARLAREARLVAKALPIDLARDYEGIQTCSALVLKAAASRGS